MMLCATIFYAQGCTCLFFAISLYAWKPQQMTAFKHVHVAKHPRTVVGHFNLHVNSFCGGLCQCVTCINLQYLRGLRMRHWHEWHVNGQCSL